MGKLKSERHHWWPESVSRHWADQEGKVFWLRPDGEIVRSTPNNFGVIGNGHHIKLSNDPSMPSPWDESFESAFQEADSNFPSVIKWLSGLPPASVAFEQSISSRIISHEPTDEEFSRLIECVVSLAVRSPMYRGMAARIAEDFRGSIGSQERNVIIGLNIRHSLRNVLKQIGGRGKAMVVFSPEREFIFGDGFFSNLTVPGDNLLDVKLFVPVTPEIAVLFVRPTRYGVNPRLVTLAVSEKETDALNVAVQVYAKESIFYRSERPVPIDAFTKAEHRIFADHRNAVDQLIQHIPGIPPRDPWLDALIERRMPNA